MSVREECDHLLMNNDDSHKVVDMQEIKLQIKESNKIGKLSNLRSGLSAPNMSSALLTNEN